MTPFEQEQLQQERIEQQDRARQELYLEGCTDAAMGESPQSKQPDYLDGYLTQLRELILHSAQTLQIRWLSRSYVVGAYDSPDACSHEEY